MIFDPHYVSQNNLSLKISEDIFIILAEDDKGHYLLTKHYLEESGVSNEMLWFGDGQSMLDFLLSKKEEKIVKKYIILLDIRMPKLDGIEVLRIIRKDEILHNTPVIMLTTSEDPQQAQLCHEIGCNAYIIKPLGESLLKSIQSASKSFHLEGDNSHNS